MLGTFHHYTKGFERALILAYGTNAGWTREELAIRRRVLRIIAGKKSTKAAKKRKVKPRPQFHPDGRAGI